VGSSRSASFTFAASTRVIERFDYVVDDVNFETPLQVSAGPDGTASITLENLSDGEHKISVNARIRRRDEGDHLRTATFAFRTWTVDPNAPPTAAAIDEGFAPAVDVNGAIFATAVQGDGNILIGGIFNTVSGQARNHLARLSSSGVVEGTSTFNSGFGADNAIDCVAVQTDGSILLGGSFKNVNGQPRNRIARLNSNGSLQDLTAFKIGSGVTGAGEPSGSPAPRIKCIAVQADGDAIDSAKLIVHAAAGIKSSRALDGAVAA